MISKKNSCKTCLNVRYFSVYKLHEVHTIQRFYPNAISFISIKICCCCCRWYTNVFRNACIRVHNTITKHQVEKEKRIQTKTIIIIFMLWDFNFLHINIFRRYATAGICVSVRVREIIIRFQCCCLVGGTYNSHLS